MRNIAVRANLFPKYEEYLQRAQRPSRCGLASTFCFLLTLGLLLVSVYVAQFNNPDATTRSETEIYITDPMNIISLQDEFRLKCEWCFTADGYNYTEYFGWDVRLKTYMFDDSGNRVGKQTSDPLSFQRCENPDSMCFDDTMKFNGWWGQKNFTYLAIAFGPCEDIVGASYCVPRSESIRLWFEQDNVDLNFFLKKTLIDSSGNKQSTWREQHYTLIGNGLDYKYNVFFKKNAAKYNKQWPYFPEENLDTEYVDLQHVTPYTQNFEDNFFHVYLRAGRENMTLNFERMTIIGLLATVGGLVGVFYSCFNTLATFVHESQYRNRMRIRRQPARPPVDQWDTQYGEEIQESLPTITTRGVIDYLSGSAMGSAINTPSEAVTPDIDSSPALHAIWQSEAHVQAMAISIHGPEIAGRGQAEEAELSIQMQQLSLPLH